MNSTPITPTLDVFEQAERLADGREGSHAPDLSSPGQRPFEAEAGFGNLMDASWAFFEQEHSRQQAMTQALREQIARDLAQQPNVDPFQCVMGRRRPVQPNRSDVIDVEAREMRRDNGADPSDGT